MRRSQIFIFTFSLALFSFHAFAMGPEDDEDNMPAWMHSLQKPVPNTIISGPSTPAQPPRTVTVVPAAPVAAAPAATKPTQATVEPPCPPTTGPDPKPATEMRDTMNQAAEVMCKPKSDKPIVINTVLDGTDSIFTAKEKISSGLNSFMQRTEGALEKAKSDPANCPAGCVGKNDPKMEISREPAERKPVPGLNCPTKILTFSPKDAARAKAKFDPKDSALVPEFSGDDCQGQAKKWMAGFAPQGALGGCTVDQCAVVNDELCPGDCSTSNTLSVESSGGKCKVRMVFSCGAPRAALKWNMVGKVTARPSCAPKEESK